MSSLRSLIVKNVGTLLLMLALIISLGFNVYLARKATFGSISTVVPIKVNTKLPSPLPLLDADGTPTQLILNQARPTIIYVFSPLCPWCKKNEANIKTLVAETGARYRFVGLSLVASGLNRYIAQGHAPFPVYLIRSREQMRQLGLIGTPETIVVSPGARVEKVWEGAYLPPNKAKIEKFFDLKLPGLQQVASVSSDSH